MLKDISISVGKTQVTGILDAEQNSITVQIQSPFNNLRAGAYYTCVGRDCHRYVHAGKLSVSAIESGEEILRELYLAGQYLQHHPEFIERLQNYITRFEKQAKAIQKERKRLLSRFKEGELPQQEFACQENAQLLAERRNVLERGSIYRRYGDELTRESGGRADIESVLRFNLPSEACPASPSHRVFRHKKPEGKPLPPLEG